MKPVLAQLLELFWLRPETALWRAFDCLLMERFSLNGRSADLGCGDGLLSYVMAGGRIADYDVFMNVAGLDGFNKGSDIYNATAPRRRLNISDAGLRYRFTWGIDHKAGLLSKARRLGGFYESTLARDLDEPLPLPEGSLDSAFSNILYWLKDPGKVLSGWRSLLKTSSRLVLFVPNESFKRKAWLYYAAPHRGGRRYLNFFDRGYGPLIRHAYRGARWESIFKRAGFRVAAHEPYLTDPVMDIWNVGTRPISPLLISMAEKLRPSERRRAKAEWVKFFADFLDPVVEGEFGRRVDEKDCAFHFYVLEKTR